MKRLMSIYSQTVFRAARPRCSSARRWLCPKDEQHAGVDAWHADTHTHTHNLRVWMWTSKLAQTNKQPSNQPTKQTRQTQHNTTNITNQNTEIPTSTQRKTTKYNIQQRTMKRLRMHMRSVRRCRVDHSAAVRNSWSSASPQNGIHKFWLDGTPRFPVQRQCLPIAGGRRLRGGKVAQSLSSLSNPDE